MPLLWNQRYFFDRLCALLPQTSKKAITGNPGQDPILIRNFKERTYEMLTDTLRALLLAREDYKTHILNLYLMSTPEKILCSQPKSNHWTRTKLLLIQKLKV